jgi:hypothetical protein
MAGNLLGLAGVVGVCVLGYHGPEYDVRQTTYGSQEDCLKDWGTEESCSRAQTSQGNAYYGPRYYWDPGRGAPVVVNPDGSTRVATEARVGALGGGSGHTASVGSFARGGFGGIGRGFGRGG